MDKVFADLIDKIMEAYADDMVAKSSKSIDHPTHLQVIFDKVLHNMCVNPNKCFFGVGG